MQLLCNNDLKMIQDEYLELLLTRREKLDGDNKMSILEIAHFIDEVEVFWRKKLKLIDHLISDLTKKYDVFFLSAAMYLGIDTNEQYIFKAIGDYQCLPDPILKYDVFVRQGMTHLGSDPIEVFFKRSCLDTINALENYKYDFLFIPSTLMIWGSDELRRETVYKDTNNLIKNMFVEEVHDLDAYLESFKTIGEIEEKIDPNVLPLIRLSDDEEKNWSLEEKSNFYFREHGLEQFASEHGFGIKERFLLPLAGLIGQAVDSIYKSSILNMIPFIQQKTPFSYLMIMLQSNENSEMDKILKKAIISHVFYNTYDNDKLAEYSFGNFKEKFMDKNLIKEIYDEKSDIYNSFEDLVELVKLKYDSVLNTII